MLSFLSLLFLVRLKLRSWEKKCLPLLAGKVLDFLLVGRREQIIIYFRQQLVDSSSECLQPQPERDTELNALAATVNHFTNDA